MRNLFFFLIIVGIFAAIILRDRDHPPQDITKADPPIIDHPPVGPAGRNIVEIRNRMTPWLTQKFSNQNLTFGSPVFIRIFKTERILELWIEKESHYELFRTFPICNHSGHLGPKLKEGDRQSPEGIYRVGRNSLNPNSSYHLSFNLGFPNAYDRSLGRTGSYLMIHGDCLSIGCYAMTDPVIEQIYITLEAALRNGQRRADVHIFPFRMTPENMARIDDTHKWHDFWNDLQPIYDAFETTRQVPDVDVHNQKYVLAR